MTGKRCGVSAAAGLAAVLLFLTAPGWAQKPEVDLREEVLTIPTYRIGAPDPNPIFYSGRTYQGAKGPVYPYPFLDKLTDSRVNSQYKAVSLENPYVKVTVLPEVGGRIFAALDKTDGYDFVYRQHVIKPALIGMTGAWISGGVEWNIPHHHRASTFIPVDYTTEDHPDGSRTIWVGEIELRHRMKWLVGMTLFPDRSYIEVTVKLFNRTPVSHSFLYFSNIAVHAGEDYQVIFPPGTEWGTQHAKREFVHWPVGDGVYGGLDRTGVDLSWWKNHPRAVSIFAWNYEDDFFGGYDHGRDAGIVHVADHHTVPGKKFFEFSNSDEGRMWDKILTDTDGPYLELMAGAYSDNQPDYSWCQPYEVKTVRQYLYPVRGLGGIKKANRDAAVNLEVEGTTARFALNATSFLPGARVVLQAGGRTIFDQKTDIGPARPFQGEAEIPSGTAPESLKVSLLAPDGRLLIGYRPERPKGAPKPAPVAPPPPPKDIKTNEELYLSGLRLEQFYNPIFEPYPYFEEALRRDAGDVRSNTELGILYCRRAMFPEAEKHLRTAVARLTRNYTSPKNGEPLYYLGVALEAQAKYDEAYDILSKAAWSYPWYAASNEALARIALRRGDWDEALAHIDRSLAANAFNTHAMDLKAAVLRKMGRNREAEAVAAGALKADPLDFLAANERRLALLSQGRNDEAERILARSENSMGNPVQAHLEIAADYVDAGLWDEAIQVLEQAVTAAFDPSRVYPMVHYWLGYCRERKGDREKAARQYRLGETMPPDYCFPFRWESIDVLENAIRSNSRDARAPYYLGNLLYDIQPRKAIAAWEKSESLDGAFAIVHRNLGFARFHTEHDLSGAVEEMERAVDCNPHDPRFYAELDVLYERQGADPEKRLALLEKNESTVAGRDDSVLREISLEILLGKYDEAIDLLDHRHFHLWEGAENSVHDLYVDAHLLRGKSRLRAGRFAEALADYQAALEYPDRFEMGRPLDGGRATEIYYRIGEAYEASGGKAKALESYRQALETGRKNGYLLYYEGMALRRSGRDDRAAAVFRKLVEQGEAALKAGSGDDFFEKFGGRRWGSALKSDAHYLLGLGLLGGGRKEEARREFQLARKLNPGNLGARSMLDEVQD